MVMMLIMIVIIIKNSREIVYLDRFWPVDCIFHSIKFHLRFNTVLSQFKMIQLMLLQK